MSDEIPKHIIDADSRNPMIENQSDSATSTGLACPFCKSRQFDGPHRRSTTAGVIVGIVGFFTLFLIVGIILLIAAFSMRETYYHCQKCGKDF